MAVRGERENVSCHIISTCENTDAFRLVIDAYTFTIYIQKAMSVQQLKFSRDHYAPEDLAHFLDFVFSPVEIEGSDGHAAVWSGQVRHISVHHASYMYTIEHIRLVFPIGFICE